MPGCLRCAGLPALCRVTCALQGYLRCVGLPALWGVTCAVGGYLRCAGLPALCRVTCAVGVTCAVRGRGVIAGLDVQEPLPSQQIVHLLHSNRVSQASSAAPAVRAGCVH
jgi:hypothetical protein